MTWLQSLLFGLVSGITEFLPVSSHAHQRLLEHMFGMHETDPVRSFVIHAAMLVALIIHLRGFADQLLGARPVKRGRRDVSQGAYDIRLIKNAAVPMVIGICVFTYIFNKIDQLPVVVIFMIINGVLLFLPERMMSGNRDAKALNFFDSILIGIAGSLSAFAGISRLTTVMLVSHARGADRNKALNWYLALSVPALIILIVIDFFSMVTGGAVFGFWSNLLGYILSGMGAFVTAYFGIQAIRNITVRTGYGLFAFYSWGMALLTFLLYLAVV